MMIARRLLYSAKALRDQWKSEESIQKLQVARLKYMATHAYQNTLFYHKKFKEVGLHPSDIQSLDDIKKIPLTTKDEMRKTEEVVARGYTPQNCFVFTTSGSTGRKLKLYHSVRAFDRFMSFQFRYLYNIGMRPWYTYAYISYDEGEKPGFSHSKFSRSVPVPSYLDTEEKVRVLERLSPDVIGGHPCSILPIARTVKDENNPFSLKFILLGGELSTKEERKYIESVFGCRTFDKYGSYELGQIACECPEHTLHIDGDNNIIEIVKDGEDASPGETGEVVGTNLWNEAMPFIRYRIGDMAVPSGEVCACGRIFPGLSSVQGRKDDFVVAGGILIPPTRIVPVFFTLPEIDAFQVIQEDEKSLTVKIVKNHQFTDETVHNLTEKLRNDVGDMEIHVEECTVIEEEKAKLRAVISKVKKE